MSEYQYYEFLALDKALTDEQRAELRELSSRADITATRFVNEYNYGDFRGSPGELMERYFDAFLYLANWGTRWLMFRLPRSLLDAETARRYCHSEAASVTETDDHLIISLRQDGETEDDWIEGDGWLASMVQARSELAAGDLRLLYLVWLLGIQQTDEDEDEDEAAEPPVPAGLGDLSRALRSVAEFLRIDQDLIAVAAETSPPMQEPAGDELAGWIEALPGTEKDRLLIMVAGGESARVRALLLRQFRERETGATLRSESSRTVAELLIAADDRAIERERTEELRQLEQQAHRTAAAAAAREARLNQLAAAGEAPWTMIDEMIATKNTTEYDQATALLLDLRALSQRDATEPAFTVRVQELRARYSRRPGLQYRLDQAGLPRS